MDRQVVADDEARRIAQHELVKGQLEKDVHARIARESGAGDADEQAQVKSVAADFKHRATKEVAETESEIQRARLMTRVSQVGGYVFSVIYGLISLEIVLQLFGARQASSFKRLLDTVTLPLLGPFRGLMPDPAVGSLHLMLSYIVALIVYALLHTAFNGLLRLFAQRKSTI
jgi:uncharacterized protein YggT (Ycf19 family)